MARATPGGLARLASRQRWTSPRHLTLLNRKLLEVNSGVTRRLMIAMPPRHGKSMFTSHYFPAWFLGTNPDKRVILASYEARFASSWGSKARDVLNEYGREIFGIQVRNDRSAADDWDIAHHTGGMVTAGVGGPITGRGADLLIIDDPVKNAEESRSPVIREKIWDWYKSTAFTRLEPGGSVVLIMTRWHADDLAGRLLGESPDFDPIPWQVLKLPAIATEDDDLIGRKFGEALWPERYTVDDLKAHQSDPYWWAALYQQDPTSEGGVEWPPEYFDHAALWFDDWPEESQFTVKTMALDPSKGSDSKAGDYAAFILYGRTGDGLEWVEADLRRMDAEQLVHQGIEHLKRFRPDGFGVESNAFQFLFAPLFKAHAAKERIALPMYLMNNHIKKPVRIRRLTEPLQKRVLRFRNTPGTRLLVQQLREWPLGSFDDGPDAAEQARRLAIELSNSKHVPRAT